MSDKTEELQAVMETLADWLDETDESDVVAGCSVDHPNQPCWVSEERIAAVAQILELTQVLYAEHMQLLQQMNEFIGAMAVAKDEATKGTKLIVANAGTAAHLIKPSE